MSKKDEALKLALEALEETVHWRTTGIGRPPEQTAMDAITALRQALANEALDKKAENARELGLDYEPAQHRAWFTVDELNAWADKKLKENPQWAEQPAQRTWVGLTHKERKEIERQYVYVEGAIRMTEAKLKEKNTQLSKPWVDLTDEQIDDIYQGAGKNDLKRARQVIAAFKEKNT